MFQIKFMCPRWGSESIPWDEFLSAVKKAGYAGIEWFPFGEKCNVQEVLDLLHHYELDFCIVMAVLQPYDGYKNYMEALEKDLIQLMEVRNQFKAPLFISAQTGREFFADVEIEGCLQLCDKIQQEYGISIYQETHRNKWSYAAHVVGPVLQNNKNVQLTFDVSHWFCVSESYLEDQQVAVNEAINHTRHIHARVGHTEGPQVWDPANEEYTEALQQHLLIWDKCVALAMQEKRDYFSITPEFGPPPYMAKGNREISLVKEQWRLNLWMKDFLQHRYQPELD
jgi:sugar phosphate isomerase/epimerase